MAIDVSDIVSEFGAYYLNSGQDVNDLLLPLRTGDDFYADLAVYSKKNVGDSGSNSKWDRALTETEGVLQPWKSDYSPTTDSGDLLGLSTPIRTWKPDRTIVPSDMVHENWLQFLEDMDKEPVEWPFVRWFMQVYIVDQLKEDMNLTSYNGIYAAPAGGATPGDMDTTVDGFEKMLLRHIASGYITPIANGAVDTLTDSEYCEYVEDFVKQVNPRLLKKGCVLKFSHTNYQKYRRGYRDLHGKEMDFTGQKSFIIDSNVEIKGYLAMEGSERIYLTPRGNDKKVLPMKNEMGKIWLEPFNYTVKILGHGKVAFDFLDPRHVASNDLSIS
jgi:hypothetical protein